MNKITTQFAILFAALTGVSHAATVTVTNADDGISNIGAPGTFYWAITNCSAGDTIAFNIPGAGPHYLKSPPLGFPLIHLKHHLLIDGYTQPGSARNTNAITGTNSAVIKIVIDASNGNTRNMRYTAYSPTNIISDPPIDNSFMASEQGGFSDSERAILGVYRSSHVNLRGLAFLGKNVANGGGTMKGICFAHDYYTNTTVVADNPTNYGYYTEGSDAYGHVNGCWFGFDPTNRTATGLAPYEIAMSGYRHRDVPGGPRPDLPNVGMIIGVAPGSLNPRAEFNVFAGASSAFDGEAVRTRVSGNFFAVAPDGVTPVSSGVLLAYGFLAPIPMQLARYDDTQPIVIGTDGDGVNDADEGNLFGPVGPAELSNGGGAPLIYSYNTGNKPYIIAGNTYGIANDGTVWPDNSVSIGTFYMNRGTKIRFGSDFNGVSDALEANRVYNNNVFDDGRMFGADADFSYLNSPTTALDLFAMGSVDKIQFGTNVYAPANPGAFVSIRGNVLVNNFPSLNPGQKGVGPGLGREQLTGQFYPNIWSNYVISASQSIPALAASSITTLNGTCGAPNPDNGYTNLFVDVYLPDPVGQTNGAKFNLPEFGGTGGWGFVQGKTYLGSFVDNGPLDSNPAVGAFSFNISGLGLAAGTKVTAAVTYSRDARPELTAISRSGSNVTLAWTGGNGSGTSGFGIQRASVISGPWSNVAYSPTNGIVLTDTATTAFYRITGPGTGMTTLFAPPVVLTP
jgi:hypothetical protein